MILRMSPARANARIAVASDDEAIGPVGIALTTSSYFWDVQDPIDEPEEPIATNEASGREDEGSEAGAEDGPESGDDLGRSAATTSAEVATDTGRYGVPRNEVVSGTVTPLPEPEGDSTDLTLHRVETRDYLDELQSREGNTTASIRLLRIIKEEGVAPASQLGVKLLDLVKALRVDGELGPSSAQSSAQEVATAVAQPVHDRLDRFAEMLDHIAFKVGVNVVEPDSNGHTPPMSPRLPPRIARIEDELEVVDRSGDEPGHADPAADDGSANGTGYSFGLHTDVTLNEEQQALLGELASPERSARDEQADSFGPTDAHPDRASPNDSVRGAVHTATHVSPQQELDRLLHAAQRMQDDTRSSPPTYRLVPPAAAYPGCYCHLHQHLRLDHTAHQSSPSHLTALPPLPPSLPPMPPSLSPMPPRLAPTLPYPQQSIRSERRAYLAALSRVRPLSADMYGASQYGNAPYSPYGPYPPYRPFAYDPFGAPWGSSSPPSRAATLHAPIDHFSHSVLTGTGHERAATFGAGSNIDTPFRRAYPDLRTLVPPEARDLHGL